jgi:hypothetical protein
MFKRSKERKFKKLHMYLRDTSREAEETGIK